MREPHKFPMVLSGVMIFLLGESNLLKLCWGLPLKRPFNSPLWRCRRPFLSHLRIRDQNGRDQEP